MPTAPERPSHATRWVLGALAGILLYFLSGPVVELTTLGTDLDNRQRALWYVDLMRAYMYPYWWLEQHPPNGLLERYRDWWWIRWASMR